MAEEATKVLVIDADDARAQQLRAWLVARGFEAATRGATPASTADVLRGIDLVLLALAGDTVSTVERCRLVDPLVPVVVVTSRRLDPGTIVALGRARTYDVLAIASEADLDAAIPRLKDAARRQAIRRTDVDVAGELLGTSPKIAQVRRYIAKAAQSDANVLITGESGTGKELVARAIHAHGARAERPFVAVNCSAIPDTLLESELFGHEKGSFTGAVSRLHGKFEQADGGTLFFDEVAEMPQPLQAKLLRVLQPPPGEPETMRELTRVGAETPIRVDVRMVFATHRELVDEVKAGRFREDLYQRIHVLVLQQPALRERREDIPLLARHFLERYGGLEGHGRLEFDPLVLDVLTAYDYPLNVRELEGLVRSLVIMKDVGRTVVLGDLPPHLHGTSSAGSGAAPTRLVTLDELEREHVLRVMEHAQGNKSQAARILGISRPALDRKLARS